MLDKTIKSTKFWAAVGTTVGSVAGMIAGAVDVPTGVQAIATVWGAFIVGRGIEDAGVKGRRND